MAIIFQTYDGFTPLFPEWVAGPNGPQPAVYAWRAWTAPTATISSSVANPRPLSDIPEGVLAMVWYASPPNFPERKTLDYAQDRPYIFYMPDGTTRTNSTNMSNQAFQQLLNNFLAAQSYPP